MRAETITLISFTHTKFIHQLLNIYVTYNLLNRASRKKNLLNRVEARFDRLKIINNMITTPQKEKKGNANTETKGKRKNKPPLTESQFKTVVVGVFFFF